MTLKEKFDLFYANMVNQKSEVSDSTNVYQCMDLAYQWIFSLDIPKATIQHLYAYQVYTQPSDLTRQYFDIIPNSATFVPQAGDLVVFSNRNINGTYFNTAGHIAIASGSGDVYRFKSFDQNWSTGQGLVLIEHNYDNPKLLGVLRPKYVSVSPVINEQTTYDFGTPWGIMQMQQVRSTMNDQKNGINNLTNEKNNLQDKISDTKTKLQAIVNTL